MDEEKQIVASDTKLAIPLHVSKSNTDGSQDIYVDPLMERRVMSKFDRYVLPQFAILVLIAYLDRSNIGESPMFRVRTHFH